MARTTITVLTEIKKQIREFGQKGQTCSEVRAMLIELTRKRQIQDLLMDEEGTIPIEVAISNLKNR